MQPWPIANLYAGSHASEMIPSAAQQLASFWNENPHKTVSLWADSTYGPMEPRDIMMLAREEQFPLTNFTCSFGGGLTVKGDFHDPVGQPAHVVFIEMGYNDEKTLAPQQAVNLMKQRKWYGALKNNASMIKFVVFVDQPSYKQTCPPKKKKKRPPPTWEHGGLVEGSKWTDEAMRLVEELGIQAVKLEIPVEELFAGMLVTDPAGLVWQKAGRSYSKQDIDYTEDGELAMWEDCWHPTKTGAEAHFRCLVRAFRARYENAGVISQPAVPAQSVTPSLPQAPQIPSLQHAPLNTSPQTQMLAQMASMLAQMQRMASSGTGSVQSSGRERSRSRGRQGGENASQFYNW